MKILFDGSILREAVHRTSSRSGIYNVANEILLRLAQDRRFEVAVWADRESVSDVRLYFSSHPVFSHVRLLGVADSLKVLFRFRRFLCDRPLLKFLAKRVFVWFGLFALLNRYGRRNLRNLKELRYVAECDAFFSPCYAPPQFVRVAGLKVFVIVHDLIPRLLSFPDYRGSWLYELERSLRSGDFVFANSECTRRDFINCVETVSVENSMVIPLGAADRFRPCLDSERIKAVRVKYGIPPDAHYLFSLCSIAPHKNLEMAIAAFEQFSVTHPEYCFVMAGARYDNYVRKFKGGKIYFIGYVDDEDQGPLYTGATAFVYLSRYEGFGLPVLEAMQCGTPVITSNVSSLPEVVGDAGLMVPPTDRTGATQAMCRVADDKQLHNELRARGFKRAKSFSWERASKMIADRLLKGGVENGLLPDENF